MINCEVLIIGGGPAGLSASLSAAKNGGRVLLIERSRKLGGQLVKQTHMFFGSEKQYASTRGIDIANILIDEINKNSQIEVYTNSTVLGLYEDGIVSVEKDGKYMRIKPQSMVVATGASEKTLLFSNNDIPGVYGAGAVQTFMNEFGIKPGKKVLMIGAGNIGLIVSYQLMQAGVKVCAIVDAAPKIGGYLVHASKIRRMGVPIYTGYTVKEAKGKEVLEGATIWQVDSKFQGIPGTEIEFDNDVMCISVGLTPLSELLWQAGCQMKFVNELGGFVPLYTEDLETTVKGIFVAGDVSGVEEASSAMVEGRLAGLNASLFAGHKGESYESERRDLLEQLESLRAGEVGAKIREGIKKAHIEGGHGIC